MQFDVINRLPRSIENACHLLFLYDDARMRGAARRIDKASNGQLKALFDSGDFKGGNNETLLLHAIPGTPASRVLLVGLGERSKFDEHRWQRSARLACQVLCATPATCMLCDLADTDGTSDELSTRAERLAVEVVCASYCFSLHPKQETAQSPALNRALFVSAKRTSTTMSRALQRALAIAQGMSLTRDLGNLAPNICTPHYLADKAESLAAEHDSLTATILDETEMESLGMGAFLAVCQGSGESGRLILMEHRGRNRAGKPVVLIGKGVTFDTGGISIKPSESMDEMKYDMCGAASVFGVMQAVASLQLPINVIGIVAAAENMPDGNACRPGDVVTSMSGQSIEILNTDAEGRLVLCDALTYAERYKPDTVIDIATLTGACIIALGHIGSAVLGNHQDTIAALQSAGERSGDRCWQLPLWDDYQSQLDSNFADMANIGGRPAGTITAACFLSRFSKRFNWAHLDIAGVAWNSGKNKGASGRPVPLLMQYLLDRSE